MNNVFAPLSALPELDYYYYYCLMYYLLLLILLLLLLFVLLLLLLLFLLLLSLINLAGALGRRADWIQAEHTWIRKDYQLCVTLDVDKGSWNLFAVVCLQRSVFMGLMHLVSKACGTRTPLRGSLPSGSSDSLPICLGERQAQTVSFCARSDSPDRRLVRALLARARTTVARIRRCVPAAWWQVTCERQESSIPFLIYTTYLYTLYIYIYIYVFLS